MHLCIASLPKHSYKRFLFVLTDNLPGGNCVLNSAWLKMDCYSSWLVQDKLKPASNARCKICLKSFDIANMGESALKSHMGGKKHKERVQPKQTVIVIDYKQSLILRETGNNEVSNKFNSEPRDDYSSSATKNDVLSAELLWTMKLCSAHYSHKSSEHSDLLFQKMFPDSAIASSFK